MTSYSRDVPGRDKRKRDQADIEKLATYADTGLEQGQAAEYSKMQTGSRVTVRLRRVKKKKPEHTSRSNFKPLLRKAWAFLLGARPLQMT
nr:hypothetical protein BaRGS_011009 [Batillaria attramentaria]